MAGWSRLAKNSIPTAAHRPTRQPRPMHRRELGFIDARSARITPMTVRPNRAVASSLFAAAGLLVALLPRVARASDTLEVDSSGSLDGDRFYSTVTIKAGGTLKVNA